jgi:predicted nucleic-acid-binding protein
MRAVDTNVLVRLITRDERKQAEAAEAFVAKGAWVSHLVLAETSWVLDSVYDLSATEVATAIDMLLNHEQLTIQDADVVAAALQKFRDWPTLSFSDALLVEIARKSGHLPVGTYDRDLAKCDGTQRI